MKSPLKWAGGKGWLVPYLKLIWNLFCLHNPEPRLVEPFCGGLSVALALNPRKALLNDINPCLINFYKELQNGLVIEIPMENDEQLYYRHRERLNQLIKDNNLSKEAAELFYYLNRTCFNGLCRFNRQGEFNVPFGRYKRINYIRDFTPYRNILRNWEFTNMDFEKLKLEPGDFVYADPPYDTDFTQYAQDDFDWADQERLVKWLAQHPGPVLISNQATPRIIELYCAYGYDLEFITAPRRIASSGDRTPAQEVLARRNFPEGVFSWGVEGVNKYKLKGFGNGHFR